MAAASKSVTQAGAKFCQMMLPGRASPQPTPRRESSGRFSLSHWKPRSRIGRLRPSRASSAAFSQRRSW